MTPSFSDKPELRHRAWQVRETDVNSGLDTKEQPYWKLSCPGTCLETSEEGTHMEEKLKTASSQACSKTTSNFKVTALEKDCRKCR